MATELDTEIVVVDVKAVARGYRASVLIGSDVINDRNETIGTIDDLIVGNDDRLQFAVLQIGGFLGLGGHLIAVPYQSLKIERRDDGFRVVLPGASREQLERLPEFTYP